MAFLEEKKAKQVIVQKSSSFFESLPWFCRGGVYIFVGGLTGTLGYLSYLNYRRYQLKKRIDESKSQANLN
jgi:hypothetical protein